MKKVAKTLKDIPTTEVWRRILDPRDHVDDIISDLKDHWTYDLFSRSPSPALLGEGGLVPTDLDLACFLSALVDRQAVINLPTYERRRPATAREGERVVSAANRHGKVIGLTANQGVFSFSVKIEDANVVTQDKDGKEGVGAPRNFMLVDLQGKWYDGWRNIEFSPTRKENAFLEDKSLWTENKIYFDNFVHPNRWVSFYGKWYLLTKVLIDRLKAEAADCFQEIKVIKAMGFALPSEGPDAEREWGATSSVGKSKTIEVDAFEAEVDADIPEHFPRYPRTDSGLVECRKRLKKLRYHDVPMLTFATRATELAFALRTNVMVLAGKAPGDVVLGGEPFPSWISGARWERDHLVKRTPWNRLVLSTPVPFEKGIALRYRVYKKTEKVAG